MSRKRAHALVVLVACASLVFFGEKMRPADDPDLMLLDTILERAAKALGGCALVVIQEDGTVYAKGWGDLGPDDLIPAASAAKWVSAAALLSLVGEGLIDLDAPLSHFLPYLADGGEPDYKAGITLRMVLSHTSGLPAVVPSLYDANLTLAECAEQLAAFPFETQPGKVFHYADLPMQLGGRAAEVVTGEPWADVFRERISEPLEMPGTDFSVGGPTENPQLAVGLRTSAREYSHFLAMLLAHGTFEGRQVLAPELVAEMLRDQTRDVAPWSREPYGLGAWCSLDAETGEPVAFSSPGALGFYPWIDLYRNIGAVFASVSGADAAAPFVEEVQRALGELFAPETDPPSP